MVSGYQEAHERAAFDERGDRGRLTLSGADARTFLHALLTNDILSLGAGTGCYAALLTPQGRMITDMDVLALSDAILLVVPSDAAGRLAARFDASIFTEDVTVADASAALAHFSITGPAAVDVAEAALRSLGWNVAALPARPYDNVRAAGPAGDAVVWRTDELAVPGLDVAVPSACRHDMREQLDARAAALSPEARLVLRLEAGRPEFHVDMTEDTIPLEANLLDRAISTTKGCYVGQEVIIRVLHRGGGRVARRLARLRFAGRDGAPQTGDTLSDGTRDVGRVTSAAWSPREQAAIGLGYVHRDAASAGVTLNVSSGGTATITAV
jgi:tRNA-modifying protein YgfZ